MSQAPPSRRRWFQFGLIDLLIAILFSALGLSFLLLAEGSICALLRWSCWVAHSLGLQSAWYFIALEDARPPV